MEPNQDPVPEPVLPPLPAFARAPVSLRVNAQELTLVENVVQKGHVHMRFASSTGPSWLITKKVDELESMSEAALLGWARSALAVLATTAFVNDEETPATNPSKVVLEPPRPSPKKP